MQRKSESIESSVGWVVLEDRDGVHWPASLHSRGGQGSVRNAVSKNRIKSG